jgi:hypothetical protein
VEAAAYREHRPAETPLSVLVESLYETVEGAWEDLCFERRYGFWRGLLDGVVARYLDCGILERGFARIRCPDCATEYLLAFITQPGVLRRILDHLGASARRATQDRAPPLAAAPLPDSL